MRDLRPILLVEDDSVDAMTVERSLRDLEIANQLVRVVNGEKALEYLRDANAKEPCIILLDFNMPEMGGMEFLKIIKEDEELKRIPVIVLTTSKEQEGKAESFGLGAAGYIVKSVDYMDFVEVIRIIDLYWTVSELPSGG